MVEATRRIVEVDGIGLVYIRPVGVLRDLDKPPRWFWYWFRKSWRRRSYWNGWLAEPHQWPDGLQKCGQGWAPDRALASLMRRVGGDS